MLEGIKTMRLFVGACMAVVIAAALIWGERPWVEATYPGKGFGIALQPYRSACEQAWKKISMKEIGYSLEEGTNRLESNGFRCVPSYDYRYSKLGVQCWAFERGVLRFQPTSWSVHLVEHHGGLKIEPYCDWMG